VIGVHFGSRGFGHAVAKWFLKAAGAKDGMEIEPCVLSASSDHRGVSCSLRKRRAADRNYRHAKKMSLRGGSSQSSKLKKGHSVMVLGRAVNRAVQGRERPGAPDSRDRRNLHP
jgi:hypothetical protein